MSTEQLLELAEIERVIAREISNRSPSFRHDPDPAQAARIAIMRAEALEALATTAQKAA